MGRLSAGNLHFAVCQNAEQSRAVPVCGSTDVPRFRFSRLTISCLTNAPGANGCGGIITNGAVLALVTETLRMEWPNHRGGALLCL